MDQILKVVFSWYFRQYQGDAAVLPWTVTCALEIGPGTLYIHVARPTELYSQTRKQSYYRGFLSCKVRNKMESFEDF